MAATIPAPRAVESISPDIVDIWEKLLRDFIVLSTISTAGLLLTIFIVVYVLLRFLD